MLLEGLWTTAGGAVVWDKVFFVAYRAPLTKEDLVDDIELKSKIDLWVKQQRHKAS